MSKRLYLHSDNMKLLAETPDKAFDVAVIDPEYGIDAGKGIGRSNKKRFKNDRKDWDSKGIPSEAFFKEVARVSTYQVIWGGNYFLDYLGAARCMFIWDKKNAGRDFADCEIAWTNFDAVARLFSYRVMDDSDERFHPTQKPVAVYSWIYQQIDRILQPETELDILDTNLGSGTNGIAAIAAGHNFTGCDNDAEMVIKAEAYFQQKALQVKAFPDNRRPKKKVLPSLFLP